MLKGFRVLKLDNSVSDLRVIRSIGIIISHAVDTVFLRMVIKLEHKIYLPDIPLKSLKISNSFLKKYYEIV